MTDTPSEIQESIDKFKVDMDAVVKQLNSELSFSMIADNTALHVIEGAVRQMTGLGEDAVEAEYAWACPEPGCEHRVRDVDYRHQRRTKRRLVCPEHGERLARTCVQVMIRPPIHLIEMKITKSVGE